VAALQQLVHLAAAAHGQVERVRAAQVGHRRSAPLGALLAQTDGRLLA
jgi:hypothetical protein